MDREISEEDKEKIKAYTLKINDIANNVMSLIKEEMPDSQLSALSTALSRVLLACPNSMRADVVAKTLASIASSTAMASAEDGEVKELVLAFKILNKTVH